MIVFNLNSRVEVFRSKYDDSSDTVTKVYYLPEKVNEIEGGSSPITEENKVEGSSSSASNKPFTGSFMFVENK